MSNEAAVSLSHQQVVTLLNEALSSSCDTQKKITNLKKVEDVIINQRTELLDNFLDEIISFQGDKATEVRIFVLEFMRLACRKDPEVISKIVANVDMMLTDNNVQVQKRAVVAAMDLYELVLKWVCRSKHATEIMENTWEYFTALKNRIIGLLESENEGIRTYVIRFMESLVLLQSGTSPSNAPEIRTEAMLLNQVPRDHRFLSYRKLDAEGKQILQRLLDLACSSSISSINLIVCMSGLTNIARCRPEFFDKVVLALEAVHANLPPTLAKSQVSSVRKELKRHLISLLKIPKSSEHTQKIVTLLTDLGASNSELRKLVPLESSSTKKRGKENNEKEDSLSKKQKIDADEDADVPEAEEKAEEKEKSAVDITADFVFDRLKDSIVANLVLYNMVLLPDAMPPQFQASYTPIAAAGTEAQKRHLARLLATQMTAKSLGPGFDHIKLTRDQQAGSGTSETVPGKDDVNDNEVLKASKPQVVPSGLPGAKASKRLQQFGLSHITKPMAPDQLLVMSKMAFERIANAERKVIQGGYKSAYMRLLVSMATELNTPELTDMLESFILREKAKTELAVLWIYEEYASYQGFNKNQAEDQEKAYEKYDFCLSRLLNLFISQSEHRESLFHRLLLEAPLITPKALDILKQACLNEVHGKFCLDTLKELILSRPKQRTELLYALLDFTVFDGHDVRQQSLELAKELYINEAVRESVVSCMSMSLRLLLNPVPPNSLFGIDRGRPTNPGKWADDSIKACLYLYLYLLPVDHTLIHELAQVYVETAGDIKRVILRQLETPVKAMGMHSPELLALVESCPKGAETLVTRIVHLLTEKAAPSPELVRRIRELYQKRVPDVRFLIPVLTGLSKNEIIAALPKLVKLNPHIVKEVFNRLLHNPSITETGEKTLSPSELLIALHNMDDNCDMKSLISAMNLLFSEKQIYSQEVLAGVIQHLVDQTPLPLLLLRSVLQALNLFPRLIGFVMNILQRLIVKQVWKQPKVWEGFIKCCQRTKPQSFQVLLQLPPPQLRSVFIICPELRDPLLDHINSLSAHQQAHIPSSSMKVLQSDPSEYANEEVPETPLEQNLYPEGSPLNVPTSTDVQVETDHVTEVEPSENIPL